MSLFGAVADHYVAAGGGGGYSAAVLADSPTIYLRLGESSGTSAADASGNSHPGTITNSPTLGVAGATTDGNTAMTFNGTSQDIDIPNFAGIPSSFTLECWVKTTSAAAFIAAWGRSGDANTPYGIWLTSGKASGITKSPTQSTLTGTTVVNDGAWHHLAFTLTSGGAGVLYVDGAQDAAGPMNSPQGGSVGFSVASRGTSLFFPGSIDEAAFYSTILTSTRIAAHYAAR